MPGIFGLSRFNQDCRNDFQQMKSEMQLLNHIALQSVLEEATICCARTSNGAFKNVDMFQNQMFLWFDGEVYESDDPRISNEQLRKPAQLFVDAYLAGTLPTLLRKLDGAFCAVLIDKRQHKIVLITDRLGMRNLYYQQSKLGFTWAAEVKAIAIASGSELTVDQHSFDCFMERGFLLEDHTWFADIELIAPATVVEYDYQNDQLTQSLYWRWSEIKQQQLSFNDAVDQAAELMIRSVKARFDPDDNQGVSLSGGLDSRLIVGIVNQLWPDYEGTAFTFGMQNCADISIAREVMQLLPKWQHQIRIFTDNNWFTPRLEKIYLSDGMLDMQHMHGSEFLAEISTKYQIDVNGYAGDAVLGGSFLNVESCDQRITPALAKRFYGSFSDQTNLMDSNYDIPHFEPHLYMNRIRRFTNMGVINSQFYMEHRRPFMSNQLLELVFSIPDHYRLNNKLYGTMLSRHFPKFYRTIPWQKTGWPISEQCPAGIDAVPGLPAPDLASLHSFIAYEPMLRAPAVAQVISTQLSAPDAIYRQLTNTDYYREFVIPHLHGNLNRSNKIMRAFTVEYYLQTLFGRLKN